MKATRDKGESDAKGLWSVAWRAIILLPFLFPLGLVWLGVVVAMGALPIAALICLRLHEWQRA
ncbi:MAG TPA: hypothetical protein VGI60_00345, partial [Chthoniobacterales bacterium]